MTYIMVALGWILDLFYRLIGNYGFAIILFTVFVKLVLFPLDIKQRRSMAKTQKIQPLLMEVQKKYANDKDKLNRETMQLYQKYGISPTSGCLPMFIQFPIIIALYWVVRKPIFYMMGVSAEDIWRIGEAFNSWAASNPTLLPDALKSAVPVTFADRSNNSFGLHEIQIAQLLFKNPEILAHPAIASWGKSLNPIDFGFLGMDLSEVPNFNAFLAMFVGKFNNLTTNTVLLWTIPILSGVSSFAASRVVSPVKKKKKKKGIILSEEEKKLESNANSSTNDTMQSMTMIMPIFSAWFAFTLPAAVGLYWIISNVIQIIQHIFVTKYFTNDVSLEELEGDIKNVKSRKKRKKS